MKGNQKRFHKKKLSKLEVDEKTLKSQNKDVAYFSLFLLERIKKAA